MSYVRGEVELLKANRHPLTKKTELLSDDLYEVESHPRIVPQNMPTALGVQVLSGAKLLMLRFYYDFLDRYLSRGSYRTLSMDTDR